MEKDLIDLNDWLTVEQAAQRLASNGVKVGVPQLYQRAAGEKAGRRRIVITSREIVGRLCLLKADVDQYGHYLLQKRGKRKKTAIKSRRAET